MIYLLLFRIAISCCSLKSSLSLQKSLVKLNFFGQALPHILPILHIP